jgi:hypothetical protein
VNCSIGFLSWEYVFYGQRNLVFVYWKVLPWPLLLRCLPGHCLFNILSFGHFVLKGHGFTFLHAKLAAVQALPTLLRQRSDIQERRSVSTRALREWLVSNWFVIKFRVAKKTRSRNLAEPRKSVEKEARA